MKLLALAAAGGALGAGLRHLVNLSVLRWLGEGFPWATLTVNVVGSMLMGVVIELIAVRHAGSPELRTFIATGILGGLTTFSAFSLDVATLIARKEALIAAVYVFASVGLSLAAFAVGLVFVRSLVT
ncbi:MAG: fluoride efflux transporter CrcB [Hyphomicrobiaceae bacterium]|nr:fluoride efflux transporter CrcB [Hyphomicrobiaceae bacterium]